MYWTAASYSVCVCVCVCIICYRIALCKFDFFSASYGCEFYNLTTQPFDPCNRYMHCLVTALQAIYTCFSFYNLYWVSVIKAAEIAGVIFFCHVHLWGAVSNYVDTAYCWLVLCSIWLPGVHNFDNVLIWWAALHDSYYGCFKSGRNATL